MGVLAQTGDGDALGHGVERAAEIFAHEVPLVAGPPVQMIVAVVGALQGGQVIQAEHGRIPDDGDFYPVGSQRSGHFLVILPFQLHIERAQGPVGFGVQIHRIRTDFDTLFGRPFPVSGLQLRAVGLHAVDGPLVLSGQLEHGQLAGQLEHDDRRVIAPAQAGVGVDVGHEIMVEFLFQFNHDPVKQAEGTSRPLIHQMGIAHPIAGAENPVVDAVHIDVNALFFQAGLQIVQPVKTAGVEGQGVVFVNAPGEIKQIRTGGVRVHLMQPHHVDAELGKPPGNGLGVFVGAEVHAAVKESSEETGYRPVFEYHFIPLNGQKAVLTRRFFLFEQERNVQGSIIPMQREGNIPRHCNASLPKEYDV